MVHSFNFLPNLTKVQVSTPKKLTRGPITLKKKTKIIKPLKKLNLKKKLKILVADHLQGGGWSHP
jgi:hypothetical protein